MPYIPPVATFVAEGLNKRPTFFGCNDTSKITVVYLPNVNYTFASNEPTAKLEYSQAETEGMVDNGVMIASEGGDAGWPTCLACAIVMKTGEAMPSSCGGCFSRYCFEQ